MRAAFVSLALIVAASARPGVRRDATALKNGQEAIALNAQYQTLAATALCTTGEDACVGGKFAQCVNGKFVTQACAAGTICGAIPLDSPKSGTLTTCTTQSDLDSRIAATGANAAGSSTGASNNSGSSSASAVDNSSSGSAATANNSTASAATGNNSATQAAAGSLSSTDITTPATADSSDAQSSLTLDSRVIASGFANNGQDVQEAGQVASLTSNNNFINFCLTQGNLPITSGQQITTGSCNPAPIGTIPSVQNMPSAKFANPANGDTIPANTQFTISMNINNIATGNFVNANENYFAAPQQLNGQGQIIGHTHVVIETLSDLAQTTPTNPQQFAFFKGVNTAAVNGAVSADVTSGVPAGAYRLCSINSSSNHQPVIVPIAQHGSLDDCVYFTASDSGSASPSATASNATAAAGAGAAGAGAAQGQAAQGAQSAKAQSAKAGSKGKRMMLSRL
ncbi:hypothetical protein D9757_002138 [Collybiopsis confluens]|uniref:Carbohydrate-binding module family 19 domain-containing protein n=1 Tax=Collybiopsis confluens TaxID=2823264 RepID=A0A8H5I027_9AGAR|nr:hypothetical protein D9757_002138 [Collybiopsis confluens]